jgi:hypothetical protein
MKKLEELIGGQISALVPFFHQTDFQRLKLHEVEVSGIWVESQAWTNDLLERLRIATSPKTAIFFLPWNQIVTILSSIDSPGLSEKGFGVKVPD